VPEIPAEIQARLDAAERVCVLYAWCPPTDMDSDRNKALYMLWRAWSDLPGTDCRPAAHPGLTDAVITDLARQRDSIRAEALDRLFASDVDDLTYGVHNPVTDPCGAPPIGGTDA
jgi:hypothetical protein